MYLHVVLEYTGELPSYFAINRFFFFFQPSKGIRARLFALYSTICIIYEYIVDIYLKYTLLHILTIVSWRNYDKFYIRARTFVHYERVCKYERKKIPGFCEKKIKIDPLIASRGVVARILPHALFVISFKDAAKFIKRVIYRQFLSSSFTAFTL